MRRLSSPVKFSLSFVVTFVMILAISIPVFGNPGCGSRFCGVAFGNVAGVPRDFWPVYTPFETARNANDAVGITTHGRRVIEFCLDGQPFYVRAAQWSIHSEHYGYVINIIWSAANNVGRHYYQLGDREGALWAYRIAYAFVDPFQALTPYLGMCPYDMEFSRLELRTKIASLDANAQLFAELRDGSGETVFFNALHEPTTGVFFGEQSGIHAVMDTHQRPSATMIYVEFEIENLPTRVEYDLAWNEYLHGFSRYDYAIIQIAWNFLHEGQTLPGVPYQEQMIAEAARYMGSLGLPILLRVGGEMDVWSTPADPAEFITAFRFIANIMRRYAPNVAMVWSVNSVSAQGLSWQMFYPGDAYVDWVGISLYTTRYFQGNPLTSDTQAAIYRTGQFANPVSFVRELVAQFGGRKPILISEGAVSLYNRANNENLTAWALPRIRQTYAYIPMLFPQVKAMFWFNVDRPLEPQRYDFAASPEARALYGQLTASEYFLGQGRTYSPVTFRRIGYGSSVTMPANAVTLLTYAPFFTVDNVEVHYRLNGIWIGQSADIPYRQVFNLTDEADGYHVLTVSVYANGLLLQSIERRLVKQGDVVVIEYMQIAQ